MDLDIFLKSNFNQLSSKDICNDNDFSNYENFKKFILNHYNLKHIEKKNYIKYVKVKRQIIRIKEEELYNNYINKINSIIKIMFENNIFSNCDIKKYMYRINLFFRLIEDKKNTLFNSIHTIRELFDLKGDNHQFKIRIMYVINNLIRKYQIFLKLSREVIVLIHKLLELESSYGIDHTLIELNNMERTILGKKSEYIANKSILEFISTKNKDNKYQYFFEYNINLLKLFDIETNHDKNIKGEIDGMIIIFDGNNYIIEKMIEVKSSIKATFEDFSKFVYLQKYINHFPIDKVIKYKNFTFTYYSFVNIINKDLTKWTIYLCINSLNKDKDVIQKSHLYFSSVLKILDDNFIYDFYINNDENCIKKKYKIILDNRNLINTIYDKWVEITKFGTSECNIYISKI